MWALTSDESIGTIKSIGLSISFRGALDCASSAKISFYAHSKDVGLTQYYLRNVQEHVAAELYYSVV